MSDPYKQRHLTVTDYGARELVSWLRTFSRLVDANHARRVRAVAEFIERQLDDPQ